MRMNWKTTGSTDERYVYLCATDKGRALKEKALPIPAAVTGALPINAKEAQSLYLILYKLLGCSDL